MSFFSFSPTELYERLEYAQEVTNGKFYAYYNFGIFRIKMWVEAVTASNNNNGNKPFTELVDNPA
jgi:hypothetical protein